MRVRNIAWWAAFIILAVWMQALLPGLDVLVVGLILCIQERNTLQSLWLVPVFIIIQEGLGSLGFGASLLWFASVVCVFYMGHWLFEAENILFMVLFSACIGLARFGIVYMMASLQYLPLDPVALFDESILQALFVPVVWQVFRWLRLKMVLRHENPA